jgi:hypothetical protein
MGKLSRARLLVGMLVVQGSLIGAWGASVASAAVPDVRGTYEAAACVGGTLADCEAHPQYPQKYVLETEDFTTGALTGQGFADSCGSAIYSITGTISGSTVKMHTIQPGYTSDAVLTLSPDGTKLQGTFSDSYERVNDPTFGTRIAGFPCGGGSKEEGSAKHVTGTQVICNYEFATSQNTCVASVGDGSAIGPTAPTGTVTFATTSGGFASGAQCSLLASTSSPTVSNCSLVYQTAYSGLPSITATYGGDSTHAGSVGHTQFLGADPSESNFESPTGPAGQYPNEIGVETSVPVAGTTVEASAEGTNAHPGEVPLVFPRIPAGLDAESVTELGLLEGIGKVVNETAGQNVVDVLKLDADAQKALEHLGDLLKSPDPAMQKDGQVLQTDLNKVMQALTKMLQEQGNATREAIKNAKGSSLALSAAAKHKSRASKPAGYVLLRHVAAGRLKVHIRLSRAVLAKLAGKRSSLTLVVRIDMILPSANLHSGVPRVFIKHITIKRTPTRHTKR